MKQEKLVFAVPHAGTDIPEDIRARIAHPDSLINKEADLYTDRIYRVDGVHTVQTPWNRIIGDCNRAPDEMYTEGKLRSIGVVILSLANGKNMFTEDPTLEEMSEWIDRFHKPFHDELRSAMQSGKFLFDCHSLASVAEQGHIDAAGHERADIVLGNRDYCSCSAQTLQFFRDFFEGKGYSVAINDPYPGRYIVGSYASRHDTPGLQIEINKKLYMNEKTLEPHDEDIAKLNGYMQELVEKFCSWYEPDVTSDERPMTNLSERSTH